MGMQTAPTGESYYVPDAMFGGLGAPADVTAAQSPASMMGPLPSEVMQGAQSGFAPGAMGLPSNPDLPAAPLPQNSLDFIVPPAGGSPPAMPDMPGQLHPGIMQAIQGGFVPPSPPRPVQNSPDFIVPVAAPVPPTKAQLAQQAAERAYVASPQGMQESAAAGQAGVLGDQAVLEQQRGDIAAKQAEEQYAIKQKQVADEQAKNAELEAKQQQYFAVRAKEHEMLRNAGIAAANAHVDPNRMWSSMSTGQRVQAGIGILLAGIGQGLNGDHGANPAMKLITDAIDRDVDAQKVDINQKNKTFEMFKDVLGDTDTQQAKLDDYAKMKQASDRLAVADQVDAAAMKYASPIAKLDAQQKSNFLRMQADQIFGTLADKRVAQAHQDAELAVQKQNANTAAYHAAIAARAQKESERKNLDDEHRADMALAEKTMADQRRADMHAKGKYTTEEQATMIGGQPNPVTDANGEVGYRMGPMTGRDGQPLTFDAKQLPKLKDMVSDTDEAVNSIDELRKIRAEAGPTTDLSKSKAWQTSHVHYATILKAMIGAEKEGGAAKLTETQLALAKEQLGQLDDPTRWNGIGPGLEEFRKVIIDHAQRKLNVEGGVDVDLRKRYPDMTKAAEVSEADKLLLRPPTADEIIGPAASATSPLDPMQLASQSSTVRNAAFKAMGGEHLVSAAAQDMLDKLEDTAFDKGNQGTKTAAAALEKIKSAAGSAQSRGVRAKAIQILMKNVPGFSQEKAAALQRAYGELGLEAPKPEGDPNKLPDLGPRDEIIGPATAGAAWAPGRLPLDVANAMQRGFAQQR